MNTPWNTTRCHAVIPSGTARSAPPERRPRVKCGPRVRFPKNATDDRRSQVLFQELFHIAPIAGADLKEQLVTVLAERRINHQSALFTCRL